jgi:hypothetical protein
MVTFHEQAVMRQSKKVVAPTATRSLCFVIFNAYGMVAMAREQNWRQIDLDSTNWRLLCT